MPTRQIADSVPPQTTNLAHRVILRKVPEAQLGNGPESGWSSVGTWASGLIVGWQGRRGGRRLPGRVLGKDRRGRERGQVSRWRFSM